MEFQMSSVPGWLELLLREKFFECCLIHHVSHKKNEKNSFCLDCLIPLCQHCLPSHTAHRTLQIRRYMYQDVLRLKDADKLLDCSFIQAYTTNSAKVVFLRQRPLSSRQLKGSDHSNMCITCQRNLKNNYLFCSISCKVYYFASQSRKQVSCKYKDGQILMDSNSVYDQSLSVPITTSLDSSISFEWTTSDLRVTHRRKSVPRRSPLC